MRPFGDTFIIIKLSGDKFIDQLFQIQIPTSITLIAKFKQLQRCRSQFLKSSASLIHKEDKGTEDSKDYGKKVVIIAILLLTFHVQFIKQKSMQHLMANE